MGGLRAALFFKDGHEQGGAGCRGAKGLKEKEAGLRKILSSQHF
jgi:hypothetical protein